MRLAVARPGYKQALLGCLGELVRSTMEAGYLNVLGPTSAFAYSTRPTRDKTTLGFRSKHIPEETMDDKRLCVKDDYLSSLQKSRDWL